MENAVIDKIRKIQALADRAGTEAEAATAAAMVAALCEKHNLDIGVARVQAEETSATVGGFDHGAKGKYQPHWGTLAVAAAKMLDVGTYRDGMTIKFFGLSASVEGAIATHRYLVESVEAMLSGWKRTGEYCGSAAECRAFKIGCATRIYEKVAALKAARVIPAGSDAAALMVVSSQLVERHQAGLKLRAGARTRVGSGGRDAYGAGYSAGARVDIHGANGRMIGGGR